MNPNDRKVALVTLSFPEIGFLTFIVFLILKLTNNVDWNWFWIWFPLWIPWALYLVASAFIVIMITIFSKRLE